MSEGDIPTSQAIEFTLPWGPVVRGLRWGKRTNRVVLLHEPETDLDAWRSLPPALAQTLDASVLVYDLPGHGLSDDPWNPDRLPDVIRTLTSSEMPDTKVILVAAGETAHTALSLAAELTLSGLVCLSPVGGEAPTRRSPRVPKLFLAGSIAANDLDLARHLAATCRGWTLVTSIPVAERGTALLKTDWDHRIADQVTIFLRDCLHPKRNVSPLPSQWERGWG